jgi:hypothetical protein
MAKLKEVIFDEKVFSRCDGVPDAALTFHY